MDVPSPVLKSWRYGCGFSLAWGLNQIMETELTTACHRDIDRQ